jgi:hypothetical protein
MSAEELDEAIARDVFCLPQEQIDAWPWGVPAFSVDRNFAAGVAARLWAFDHLRIAFEHKLRARVPRQHGGIVECLFVCTPGDICNAALETIREFSPAERFLTIGTGLRTAPAAVIPVDSAPASHRS